MFGMDKNWMGGIVKVQKGVKKKIKSILSATSQKKGL